MVGKAYQQKQEDVPLLWQIGKLGEQENRIKQTAPLEPTPTKPHLAKLRSK